MSCLDVMYHQSYGAHYLPASTAAAYKAAYYHHHHQQQQKKLSVFSKMHECLEPQQHQPCPEGRQPQQQPHQGRLSGERVSETAGPCPPASKDSGPQPAEAEYLSSRCVLFTYFHGDIGDVVDEHFSRALSQPSAFSGDAKPTRAGPPHASAPSGPWRDSASLPEGQSTTPLPSPIWNSAYPSQTSPCLSSVSVSVHPDFSPSPVAFHPPDGALWAGHALSQPGLPDAWAYGLNPQGAAGYPHIHDVYPHPHTHMHSRHSHAMLHSHPDPRFGSLLLPGVRGQCQPATSPGSRGSSHSEGIKTEMDPGGSSPVPATSAAWAPSALHGALETYDSALDQDKVKAPTWF